MDFRQLWCAPAKRSGHLSRFTLRPCRECRYTVPKQDHFVSWSAKTHLRWI